MMSDSIVAEPRSSSVDCAARAATASTSGSSAAIVATAPVWPVTPSRIDAWHEVGREGLQEGGKRVGERNAMRAGDGADGDAVGAVSGKRCERRMRPAGGRGEEGRALQRGFAVALQRAGQRFGQFGEVAEIAAGAGAPPGLGKQHRVVPARAELDAARRASPPGSRGR